MSRASGIKKQFLHSGMIFAKKGNYDVTTILGSCVAVCLWDPKERIGGINHFFFPYWNGEGLSSPKYGNIAIEKLIQLMLKLGSKKSGLKAKVFGGASTLMNPSSLFSIGERNIALAKDILIEEKIPIISSDVGGYLGRKIVFRTETGRVLVKTLKSLNSIIQ